MAQGISYSGAMCPNGYRKMFQWVLNTPLVGPITLSFREQN